MRLVIRAVLEVFLVLSVVLELRLRVKSEHILVTASRSKILSSLKKNKVHVCLRSAE